MTENDDSQRDARARGLGAVIAALTPALAMIAASAQDAAIQGGDGMVSAALGLEPARAPGHPLAVLLARAFVLLPLGAAPARAALASCVALGAAAALGYLALYGALRAQGLSRVLVAAPIALGATFFAFASSALFATGPRVDAVAIALGAGCLERVCAFNLRWPRRDLAPLRVALACFAFLLLEAPLLAALLLVAASPTLRRLAAGQRLSALLAAPLGFALLPAGALACLVDRADLALTAWPASLPAWLQSCLRGPHEGWLHDARFGPAALVPALFAGGLLMLRPSARRVQAPFLALALACTVVSALAPEPLLVGPLAAFGSALLLGGLFGGIVTVAVQSRLAVAVALASVLVGATALQANVEREHTAQSLAPELIRDALLRSLPPRAVVLVAPELAIGLRDALAEERLRPDVSLARKPWSLDLPEATAVQRTRPELQALLRAHLLAPGLPLGELSTLASRRPVLLEYDFALERDACPLLVPRGLYHEVGTRPSSKAELRVAGADSWEPLVRLRQALRGEPLDEPTRGLLRARLRADGECAHDRRDSAFEAQAAAFARDFGLTP